jgi:ATP-dependent DNA helicase PIF1
MNTINLQIQAPLTVNTTSYKSVGTVVDVNVSVQYPVEFLLSLEPSGMASHNLLLKVGSPIMHLRNLDAPILCNSTRLIVKSLMPHVIEATILTGCTKGDDVFLPGIPMIPTDMPFEFKRLQFPARLTSAISINRA